VHDGMTITVGAFPFKLTIWGLGLDDPDIDHVVIESPTITLAGVIATRDPASLTADFAETSKTAPEDALIKLRRADLTDFANTTLPWTWYVP